MIPQQQQENFGLIIKSLKVFLISVYYYRIVAKSNRINGYLDGGRNSTPIDTVVGAKFNPDKTKHIITHYISKDILGKTINISMQKLLNYLKSHFQKVL